MIVVPNTLEQSINAARVEQLQAGLYLDPARLNVATLQKAAERVLTDRSLVEGVERMRRSFVEAGGVQRAAESIQAFKQKHGMSL